MISLVSKERLQAIELLENQLNKKTFKLLEDDSLGLVQGNQVLTGFNYIKLQFVNMDSITYNLSDYNWGKNLILFGVDDVVKITVWSNEHKIEINSNE